DGAVLVDGLRTDENCFGVIVNLTGENSPELSVDRKKIIESPRNKKILTRVLSDAITAFTHPDGPAPTVDWLCEFAEEHPVVGDLAFQTVLDTGRALALNGRSLDFARLGLSGPDRLLVSPSSSYRRPDYTARSQARRREIRGAEPLTDHLAT